MTPLKILQMATQSATAFKFTLPFAQYLMERGHHVAIACTDAAFPDAPNHLLEIRRTGVPVHIIPMQRTIAPGHDLLATLRAWRLMCLERFDVVHTHNAKAGFIGRLAARAALTPLVLHTNHGLPFFVADRFSWGENYLHLQLERLAARWTDRFFTVSQAEWRKAITFGVAAPSDMVQIGQGIDLTLFDPQCVSVDTRRQLRERWSIPAAAPLLGVVARLEPHKGVERVLHAVAEVQHRHPDLHVLIIGDGREQASLQQLAHGLGVAEQVRFTGHLREPAQVRNLYAIMDLFCLPTQWESFGVVFAEAMAMGLPVIAPDMEPIRSVVGFQAGVLIPATPDDHRSRSWRRVSTETH